MANHKKPNTKPNNNKSRNKQKRNNRDNLPRDASSNKSYIDYLPEDILHTIHMFQHQLNFKDSLNFIKKLRITLDSDTKIPLRKLLKKATDRKLIYIDVGEFDCSRFDNNTAIMKEFNTNKIQLHQGLLPRFTQMEIKLCEKTTLLIIDVLYILYELGLTKQINNKVVDVITEDLRKTAMVHFTLEYY